MKKVIAVFLVTWLMACSTNPGSFRHYQFSTTAIESQPGFEDLQHSTAVILSLTVPDYLKQNKMIIQVDDGELQYSQLHLWAQLPAKAIHNQMRKSINLSAKGWYVTPGNQSVRQESSVRLHVNLSHFYPTTAGEVVMAGDWLFSMDGKPQTKSDFSYQRALTEDGYAAALKTKAVLIEQLAQEINQHIARNLPVSEGH
ncbi:PqiC family protein [Planctobacterium marinum]|uniref:Lipoprotein n=1 Tax=Planctobacterium marinum TaxID=1631968 RepID=A0AA48KU03_9ALTE|nr:lipoprotein [Planctobacterium marinum]